MSRSREERAAQHEELAAEATRRAARVTSTDEREATASIKHYRDRADHHAARARGLRNS
ncbi:hypothetical protein ABZ348_30530 [Streptomyces sp. NPDC005963]|uniref:hypothetical protein n=1 Tax=Streptomyces sp. NPDC005963 TaxID=3156721 RepID=UPI0033C3AB4A